MLVRELQEHSSQTWSKHSRRDSDGDTDAIAKPAGGTELRGSESKDQWP